MKIRLHLSYDGTDYGGWQRQNAGKPTVQGTLEKALTRLFDSPVTVRGAGRTDAGVHAASQVAHFLAPKPIENYNLVVGINSLTPSSLAVTEAFVAPDDFHALASATKKTYKYRILNSPTPDPLRSRFSTWVRRPLHLDYLNEASQYLLGLHDFKSFQTAGTDLKTTERRIDTAHWAQVDEYMLEFTIEGNGFLKQMVRNVVGTQLDLFAADAPPQAMKQILDGRDRRLAKGTAAPEGLHLMQVHYPEDLDSRCRKI